MGDHNVAYFPSQSYLLVSGSLPPNLVEVYYCDLLKTEGNNYLFLIDDY